MARGISVFFALIMMFSLFANSTQAMDSVTELEALADGEWLVLTEDETIIFIYRPIHTEIDSIRLCCGIQEAMRPMADNPRLWELHYPVPRLDEAVIGYSFREIKDEAVLHWSGYEVWRGENAPEAPPRSYPLQGRVQTRYFASETLDAERQIMIYYPPDYDASESYPVLYLADGESTENAAYFLERLIIDGDIAPMLLVGAFSSNYRAEEYLPGLDENRFESHKRFFTEELRLWAEDELGASTDTSERAIYGHSNGGVFAATMALLHPEIYGVAFPFSAGLNPFTVYPDAEIDSSLKLYFTAGTLEGNFLSNTREVSRHFAAAGAEVQFRERVAGHDFIMWQEELYHGLRWAFGE